MRKKAVVTMLASSMLCLVLAGCGGSKGADTAAKEADSQKTVEATQAEETTKPEETTQPVEEKAKMLSKKGVIII